MFPGGFLLFTAVVYLLKSLRYVKCWYREGSGAGVSLVTNEQTMAKVEYKTTDNSAETIVPKTSTPLNPPRTKPTASASSSVAQGTDSVASTSETQQKPTAPPVEDESLGYPVQATE